MPELQKTESNPGFSFLLFSMKQKAKRIVIY